MPLFTMPKKAEIKQEETKSDKILTVEIKMQPKQDLPIIEEDYAILGCNKLKFYYLLYQKGKQEPLNRTTYSYLPDNDILENRILCEMYALKMLIEYLKMYNKNKIIVYSNIKDLDVIKNYSQIKDMCSMFRYKAKEIITLLDSYAVDIIFKEATAEIQEVIDGQNKI